MRKNYNLVNFFKYNEIGKRNKITQIRFGYYNFIFILFFYNVVCILNSYFYKGEKKIVLITYNQ